MLAAVRRREKAASQLGFVLAPGPAGPRSRRSQTWHLWESSAVPATPGTSCGPILALGCEDRAGLAAPVSRGAGGSSERRAAKMVEFFFFNRDQIHGKMEYFPQCKCENYWTAEREALTAMLAARAERQ